MMHKQFCLAITLPLLVIGSLAADEQPVAPAAPEKQVEIPLLPDKLPELQFPAYFDELDKCERMVFLGRYRDALDALKSLDASNKPRAAISAAAAMAHVGQLDQAIEALSSPAVSDQPEAQLLRARLLARAGQTDAAINLLKTTIQTNPDSLAAHYYLGAISEQIGDAAAAKDAYGWIYQHYYDQWVGNPQQLEDAEQVTLLGRALDRHATLTGAYANNVALHNQILNIFVRAYDVIDREYWPAHLAAAEYFYSHGTPKEAQRELIAALELNPAEPRCFELLGRIALDQFNFDAADKAIAAMRKLDQASFDADLLESRSLLAQRRPELADPIIGRAIETQPDNLDALGLRAASQALQLKENELAQTLTRIEQIDPDNATAYFELGEQLGAMRQYNRAEKMYEIAIERAPWFSAARNGLGLLLTQSGDEEKAKIVLDAAYKLDPFNFRTTNYLILLDKLTKMARVETDHFVIMYDPTADPIVPDYFADYLESIHADVCRAYGSEPGVKTYIEVFPTHDAFSARITGAPWIGTVGASTGRVIAICAPRSGGNTLGPFNWASVLRHEYTHTVTLAATHNRITHWMTEGLAVHEEQSPMRWEWAPMLYEAVTKNELFDMNQLTWAFVRPKRPQDRSLAYAQSWWVCSFIEEKWGHEAILKMMDRFAHSIPQDQVFPEVLGVSTDEFTKQFFAWAGKQVAGWGYDQETTKQHDKLVEDAEDLMRARDYPAALQAWTEIAQLRPYDALPHMRLAGIYLSREINDPEQAIVQLDRLHRVSLNDNRFAKRIARICLQLDQPARAAEYAMQAIYVDAYDMDAHLLLRSAAEAANDPQTIGRETRVIQALEQLRRSREQPPKLEATNR